MTAILLPAQNCRAVYSQGDTYEEATANIKDAINLHLQDRLAEKEKIPTTKSVNLSTVHITF